MINMMKNEFSWSKSQDKEFSECERKYYYSRYGNWEGWAGGTGDAKAKELYFLKKLKHKEMWVGEAVHETIRIILLRTKIGTEAGLEKARQIMEFQLASDFDASKKGLARRDPKRFLRLFEHEYGIPITNEDYMELKAHALACIDAFFKSESYLEIIGLDRENWVGLEQLQSFELDGSKIFVKLDFAFRKGREFVILDWKTGRSEDVDYSFQQGCYALFAKDKYGLRPEDITIREVNLAQGKETEYRPDNAKLEWTEAKIRKSIAAIKAKICDPENGIAHEDNFQKTTVRSGCNWCKYRRVCEQAKESV